MYIDKEELFEILERKYGDLKDYCGCYVGGEWLSVGDIVDCINECTEYNDEDF